MKTGKKSIFIVIGLFGIVTLAFFFKPAPPSPSNAPLQALLSFYKSKANWPIFRGDSGLQGKADAQLATELTLLWRFQTQGPITASPAVANGIVYAGSDDFTVYALDALTGKKRWQYKTEDVIEAPISVFNDLVLAGSLDGRFYALNSNTGHPAWTFETEAEIKGGANAIATESGDISAILLGSWDYFLYRINLADGQVNWRYETENYINGTPAIAGDTTVFGGCDGFLHIVSLADGKKRHSLEIVDYTGGSVAVSGNYAYFGTYEGRIFCVDIRPDVASPILWQHEGEGDSFLSSPAVAQNRVVIGCQDMKLYCFHARTGDELWTFTARSAIDSSPVICGDKVVVGSDDGRLYLLQLDTGRELWRYDIGAAITATVAVANNLVIVAATDGFIYAFGPSAFQDLSQQKQESNP